MCINHEVLDVQVYTHINNLSSPNYVAIEVVYRVQNRTDFQCLVLLLHPEILWEKHIAISALPLLISLGTGAQRSGQRKSLQKKGSVTAGESRREALERKTVQSAVKVSAQYLSFRQTSQVQVKLILFWPSLLPAALLPKWDHYRTERSGKSHWKLKVWSLPCNLMCLHYWFVLAEKTPGSLDSSSKNHKHMFWKFSQMWKVLYKLTRYKSLFLFLFGLHRDLRYFWSSLGFSKARFISRQSRAEILPM